LGSDGCCRSPGAPGVAGPPGSPGGYFPTTAGDSALRTVSTSFAVQDVTQAPGFLVTMTNEGAAAETFHVTARCAKVS